MLEPTPVPAGSSPAGPRTAARRSTPLRRRVLVPAALIGVVAAAGHLLDLWPRLLAPLVPLREHAVGPPDPVPVMPIPEEDFNLENLRIDRGEIRIGGPPKDAIPALTRPEVAAIDLVTYLEPEDRVVGLTVGAETRAYPLRVLTWHEAVNDELGGAPIAIVYCPLSDSVSVIDRRLDGRTYEFGISGLLYRSNVLLFDRTDEALWSQIAMQAISGPNAGRSLRHLDGWQVTTFGAWRAAHPDSTVLTLATGHRRDYDFNPYVRLQETDRTLFPMRFRDERLPPKTPIIGVRIGERARAYPLETVAAARHAGLRDTIDGRAIHLRSTADGGLEIVEMPEDGAAIHAFWFSWVAAHPATDVHGDAGR